MLTIHRTLRFSALLLVTSLVFANDAQAAKSRPAVVRKSPVKVKTPQGALHNHGQNVKINLRPTARVYSSASAPSKKSSVAARPSPLAGHAAVARQPVGSGFNAARVASRVDGLKRGELSAVNDRFRNVGQRVQNGRLDSQLRGANSAVLAGLNQVMPGFQTRGTGPSSLKDLGVSGGNHRNPVGGKMDQFTGGGAGHDGKGRVKHHPDGSSTIKNKDGSTTDVWKDGTFVTHKKDGTTEVNRPNGQTDYYGKDGRKQGTVGISRKILDPSNPGYYTDGTKIDDDKGSKDKKQGSKKEPTPDDAGESSSGPRYITGADLRGLGARLGAKGEPTGDEGTTGGPVNESRTRTGRIGQVGQPADTQEVSSVVVDNLQIRQIARLRLRRIEPINE